MFYPQATFEPGPEGKVEYFEGTIHKNYQALDKECLYIPDDCNEDFETNAHAVYMYFVDNEVSRVNYNSFLVHKVIWLGCSV